MALFEIVDGKLVRVKSKQFALEKEIQQLTEDNLDELFSLKFVKSEFSVKNFRIDTLAYDEETSSFIIIEYKKDKNFSVIDQGYAYLSIMLKNKADFVLEYNEKFNTKLKKTDIEWSQSKVLFIAPSFTSFQKIAINIKDLSIELWEIKKIRNDIVSYERITSNESFEKIDTIKNLSKTEKATKEKVNEYSEENLLKSFSDRIKNSNSDLELAEELSIWMQNPIKSGNTYIPETKIEGVYKPSELLKYFPKRKRCAPILKLRRLLELIIEHNQGEWYVASPQKNKPWFKIYK